MKRYWYTGVPGCFIEEDNGEVMLSSEVLPEIERLNARIAELEAAQLWHPASELPPVYIMHGDPCSTYYSVQVEVCRNGRRWFDNYCFSSKEWLAKKGTPTHWRLPLPLPEDES